MKKTIHGCTCKEEWSFTPDGKKYKGCVVGGPDNALCPLSEDIDNIKESCKGSSHSRPYCVVKEKNCGWVHKDDSGMKDGEGIDWCDWSTLPFGEARNTPPLIIDEKRYYVGLLIYITVYSIVIPWVLYATNKLYLLAALLPNYHLFAEALSFHRGFGGGHKGPSIFSFLVVNESSPNTVSVISNKILTLCSLLGLVYIVVINSLQKGVLYGVAFGIIILIMTHLLGSFLISKVCSYLYYRVFTYSRTKWKSGTRAFISALGGVAAALLLIFIEALMLKKLRTGYINKIANIIMHYIN